MNRARYDIAQVIKRFAEPFIIQYNPNGYQRKVLRDLSICRTAELGGHKEQCDECGTIRYSYNSCGNRHCPKCQHLKQKEWVEQLLQMTIPVKHYHIVFTVPHELNAIAMLDSRWFYNLLFQKTWETLHSFGYTRYGVEGGAIMVLHTWGQNLSFHPHIHCIVPSIGDLPSGKQRFIGKDGKFLYPVAQLSVCFRGKIMESIKRKLSKEQRWQQYQSTANLAWKKPWNIHCEPALAKAEHVVRYLGQYTHRVAISNQRIININQTSVSFLHKDYKDNATIKPISLDGTEFLRRFCQHILPRAFVKIRRYGIYSNRYRAKKMAQCNKINLLQKIESSREKIERLTGLDLCVCPNCKKGTMHVIELIPRARSPGNYTYFKSSRF